MMCFGAKAVGGRLGSCFELVDKRSSWQFCAYFLHQAKVRLKFVCISTIVSPWGFLNRKIKYLPLTGKSNCHLPSACFPFGLLNSSFLSMVVVVKAATLEHFGIFWNLTSCQNTECLHGNVLMEFAKKSIKCTAGFVIIRLGIKIRFLSVFSSNFLFLHSLFSPSLCPHANTQRPDSSSQLCGTTSLYLEILRKSGERLEMFQFGQLKPWGHCH